MSFTEGISWVLIYSILAAFGLWILLGIFSYLVSSSKTRRIVKALTLLSYAILFIYAFFWTKPATPDGEGLWTFVDEPTFIVQEYSLFDQLNMWVGINSTIITSIWLVGILVGILRFVASKKEIKRYTDTARICREKSILESISRFQLANGIHKRIEVYVSAFITSPITVGFLKPAIYLPVGMSTGFSSDELDAILAHEMVHIKNRDYILNLFLIQLETVCFFNPFILLMIRDLRKEMEYVCDDSVTEQFNQITYAKALVKLQEFNLSGQLAMAAKNNNSEFKNRIERMINSNNKSGHTKTGIVLILATVFLLSSAFVAAEPEEKIPEEIPVSYQQDSKDTLRFSSKSELMDGIKGKKPEFFKNKVLMVNDEEIKFIIGKDNALKKADKMMEEIHEELIKDGLLNESRQKMTLMFQYSDLLNGKANLGDKYEKYKAIFNRYFPVYDSFATTRVFRYKQ